MNAQLLRTSGNNPASNSGWKLAAISSVLAVLIATASYHSYALAFQGDTSSSVRVVTKGAPLKSEINGSQIERLVIPLDSDTFVQFRIEQHGAALVIVLKDPQDREVIQMESQTAGHGPLMFSAIADQAGQYRLEVKPVNVWALTYPYEIYIDELRRTKTEDGFQIAAEKAFADARRDWNQKNPQAAIRNFETANQYWSKTENVHWRAAIQYALSEAYRDSDRKQHEIYLKETLNILNAGLQPNDWRLKASALNDLGYLYSTLSGTHKDEAPDLLNQALALFATHNDRRGQASVLNNLANIEFRARNVSRAREIVTQALAFRQAENDKPGASTMISALGVISDSLGEPEEALKYLRQALQYWEMAGELNPSDTRRKASVLNSLAAVSDKLGRWDEAFDYYERALALYPDEDPFRAVALDNKGELYASLGNLAKAQECYDQALKVWSTIGKTDADLKAALLVHIGQLSILSGDIQSSIKTFEEALRIEPPQARRAIILTNLATALSLSDKPAEAMRAYNDALGLQVKLLDQRGQALTLQKRGEAFNNLGRGEEASNDLQAALKLWRTVKDQRGEAATLNAIAKLEQARGDLSSALVYNTEGIKIVESQRTGISSYQLRTTYFSTKENYYSLDIDLTMQLSKTGQFTEYVTAALEANEKARARVLLDALNEAGVGRSVSSDTSDPRFSSMIEQRLKLLSAVAAKAQARTRFLNGPHSSEQIAVLDRELQDLSDKYDDLQSQIRKGNPKFAKLTKPEPATLQQIQEQLDDDTSLIEYALGESRSYVWVINRDSIDAIELKPRNEIESYANRLKEALSARGRVDKDETPEQKLVRVKKAESDYAEASTLMSEAVLAPIASKLTRKRLLIVADGALQMLPFTALPNPKIIASTTSPTQLMIENHELISLPSASVMVLQRKELAQRKAAPYVVAVIADPVFGKNDERAINASKTKQAARVAPSPANRPGNNGANTELTSTVASSRLTRAIDDVGLNSSGEIRRLPFAGREASAILNIAPPKQTYSAIGFKANRATMNDPKLAQYRMIHLATHGVMDPKNPELSGMLLSMLDEKGKEQNGYVGLTEIYNLNLPADLVVLSACETGTGKLIRGEGLIALTRGFMYAGAARLVASLWRVDDEATALLMASFYKQMLINKLQPAAALREAQRQLAQQRRWSNPHYWAGFVIQGEWR